MSIVMVMELPGVTTDQYDELNRLMGINGPGDEPAGLISHVCAKTDEGLLIVDVWRSQADFDDFATNRIGPAAEKVGAAPTAPRKAELHNHMHTHQHS
jgi:hypothetical protein